MSSGQASAPQSATGPLNDVSAKLAELATRAKSFTAAGGASIALFSGDRFVVCTSSGSALEVGAPLPLAPNFAGFRTLKNNVLRCTDTDKDPAIDSDACRAARIKSILIAPVGQLSSAHAALAVVSSTVGAFTETHVAVLKTLAEVLEQLLPEKEKLGELLPKKRVDEILEHPFNPAFDDIPKNVQVGSSPQTPFIEPADTPVRTPPAKASDVPRSPAGRPASSPSPSFAGRNPSNAQDKRTAGNGHKGPAAPAIAKTSDRPAVKTRANMPPASKTTYGNVLNLASDPAPKRTLTASKRRAEQSATRISSSTVPNKKSSTWLYASLVGIVAVAAITWAAYSHFADRSVRASETPPSLPPVVGGRDTSQVAAVSHGTLDQAPRVTTEVVTTASAASLPLPPSSPVTKDEKKVAAKASNLDRFEAALKGSVLVSQTPTRPAASARGSGEETAPEVQVAGSPTTLTDALNVSSTSAPVLKQSQIVPSRVVSMIPPTYPEDARRYGIQGAVVINAIVKKTGVVDDVRAVSGPPMLYNAAISAVRRWRYKPALSNGEPVDSNIQIVLQFKTAQ